MIVCLLISDLLWKLSCILIGLVNDKFRGGYNILYKFIYYIIYILIFFYSIFENVLRICILWRYNIILDIILYVFFLLYYNNMCWELLVVYINIILKYFI